MAAGNYHHPDGFETGRLYLWLEETAEQKSNLKEVEFVSYRPHPAEALVRVGGRLKTVHRRFLFALDQSARG